MRHLALSIALLTGCTTFVAEDLGLRPRAAGGVSLGVAAVTGAMAAVALYAAAKGESGECEPGSGEGHLSSDCTAGPGAFGIMFGSLAITELSIGIYQLVTNKYARSSESVPENEHLGIQRSKHYRDHRRQ